MSRVDLASRREPFKKPLKIHPGFRTFAEPFKLFENSDLAQFTGLRVSGFLRLLPHSALDHSNLARLRAFFTLNNFEFDFVAFIELRAAGIIRMNEDILAAIVRRDKSKTLACVKKLYCACLHFSLIGREPFGSLVFNYGLRGVALQLFQFFRDRNSGIAPV